MRRSREILPAPSLYRAFTDALILTTLTERACATHHQLYCCFIDFKKAFDSADHQLLFHKLYSLSFDSKLLRLLVSTYGKELSCVLVNGKLRESNVGVRQGCPMSPVLFHSLPLT